MRHVTKILLIMTLPLVISMRPADAVEGPVKWLTMEEAIAKSATAKKKIFIDVYTDWCGYCKVMDKNTFSDPTIAKILNEDFYPVKLNAEQREEILFKGHTFKFIPNGRNGYHELAAALLNNQLSYPTVVFLDEEFNGIMPVPGYRQPDEFHRYLTYISKNYYKMGEAGAKEFEKDYRSPYTK